MSIICTNIEEIMGGRCKIWKSGKNRMGLINQNGSKIPKSQFQDEMSFSDGKLEFCTYSSSVHAGLGITKRIAQDKGPFIIKFKEQV